MPPSGIAAGMGSTRPGMSVRPHETDVNAGPLAPENFRPRSRENVWQYRVLVDLSLLETTLADLGVLKRARLEKPDQQQDDDDYGKNAATDVHRSSLFLVRRTAGTRTRDHPKPELRLG